MNRRSFIQSLAAVFSLPAMPLTSLRPVAAGIPAAADVPARVKSWAVYMSNLHGDCTPLTLHRLLHIPEADATHYVRRLIADGVLKPNPLLQQSLRKLATPEEGNLPDAAGERLEFIEEAPSCEVEAHEEEATGDAPGDAATLPDGDDDADQAMSGAHEPADQADETVPPQYPSSSPLIT
jgi:hypothetical protein